MKARVWYREMGGAVGCCRARAQAALGIGDNIFLMTQVQTEASGRDAWHGAPAGLAGRRVITPAGFVPPGTFAVWPRSRRRS